MRPRLAAAAALVVSLASTPILAQTTAPVPTQTAPARDEGFDWGLLGLLGLAGLIPLFMRKDTRTHSVDATHR